MSLAPVAYLLFQHVMRHDPADDQWLGRDRFVLSCGHSSLTLYIQLYLSGYGLELDDLEALRTWGSQDARPPRVRPHPRASRSPPARSARASPTRSAWRWPPAASAACSTRTPPPAQSPFDHHISCIASDGDIEEGVTAEASSLAGHQQLGNLVVIYDDNHISIEDDTNVAFTEDVAARYEAYGWHVQTVDCDQRRRVRRGRRRAAARRSRRPRPRPTGRRSSRCARSSAGRRRTSRTPARRTAPRSATTRSRATKEVLGFDPEQTSRSTTTCWRTPAQVVDRGRAAHDEWQRASTPGARPTPSARRCSTGMARRELPDGWADALPTFDADPKGMATRKASGEVLDRARAACCPSCGAARPTSPRATTPR